MEEFSSQEKLIETYIKENKKEQAVELLFDLIARYAEAQHFGKAELLRERLFEVDSMALDEIVNQRTTSHRSIEECQDFSYGSGAYGNLVSFVQEFDKRRIDSALLRYANSRL